MNIFSALALTGGAVHLSPVVVSELANRHSDEIASMKEKIRRATDSLAQMYNRPTKTLWRELEALSSEFELAATESSAALIDNPLVFVTPYPNVRVEDLVSRSAQRRRPFFRGPNGQTFGQNDVLVWEGLKELLRREPDHTIIFVTSDRVFYGQRGHLNRELATELEQIGMDPTRVVITKTLHHALAESIILPNRSRDDAVADLLWGIASDFPIFAFGWLEDPITGAVEPGEYTLEIDPRLTGVRLLNIVNTGRFRIEPGNPAVASLDVRLEFEAMSKWRDRNELGAGLEYRLSHPNSGTSTVGLWRTVRVVAEGCRLTDDGVATYEDLRVDLVPEGAKPSSTA